MQRLQRLKETCAAWIWTPLADDARWWRRQLVTLARIALCVGNDLRTGALSMRAMGLVFTTLLSLVPLLAVSFSVLKGFGVHNQVEPALQQLLAPLGERSQELTERIVGFVDNIEVGVLGAVGLALLLYTAISLVQKIEESFNYTWNVHQRRTLARRFSDYLSVMVIGPLLVFLALGITASLSSNTVVQAMMDVEPFGGLLRVSTRLAPYVLVILAFTFIYILIPNTRVRLRHALYGAVVAGLLWETLGKVFAMFAGASTNFTAIYSSFAILLLFMIWLHLSWLILLLGSSIAFYRQYPEYLTAAGREGLQLSHEQDERAGLAVMFAIVRAWYAGTSAPDRDALARELQVPVHPIDRALEALQAAGLVTLAGEDEVGFLPARPPERISVRQVLDAVRRYGERARILPRDDSDAARAMNRIDRAVDAEFEGVSVATVVSEESVGDD
jgi:membrane protein